MKRKKIFFLSLFYILNTSVIAQLWQSVGQLSDHVYTLYSDSVSNTLYASGLFAYADGKIVRQFASWNGIEWDSVGSGLGQYSCISYCGQARAIARYNGELYAAGHIDWVGNMAVHNFVKWNGTAWDSVSSGVNSWINILTLINGNLYAGGFYDTIAGINAQGLAQFDGTNWSEVGALQTYSSNWNAVNAVVFYNGELYIGGGFSLTIKILHYNGTSWNTVGNNPIQGGMSGISSMAIYNNELYVAGGFGSPDNNIARWDGNSWNSVGGGTNNGIRNLFVFQNALYAVGDFTTAGGIPASHIAKWDGAKWCGLGSVFDNAIGAITSYNDTLYVGGGFWSVDGDSSIHYIAKWIGGSYVDTCSVVGVNEINGFENLISIYPNPVKDNLTIEISTASSEKKELSIYNTLGQEVVKKSFSSQKQSIDVSALASGVYFVEVRGEKGAVRRKVVKM